LSAQWAESNFKPPREKAQAFLPKPFPLELGY
jgi:hypothetical protein